MKNSELFKEAVADAKALKASALVNAKAYLEEAFTPRLQSMLSAKLREELEDEDEEVTEPVDADNNVSTDSNDEISSEEIDAILKELDGEDNTKSPVADVPSVVSNNDAAVPSVDTPSVTTTPPSDVKTVEAPVMVVAPGAASTSSTTEPVVPPTDSASPPTPVVSGDSNSSEDEDINLEELLSSLREEASDSVAIDENDSEKEDDDLDEQLSEACKTIEFLRGQLNEVNLLNAKLLYTNKLFKAHALDDKQKMKIIESFDLAKSIREVKLTFNNLSEAMNFNKVSNVQKRSTIAEGLSSKSIGTTKPVATTIVQAPVNEMANRFQKLAGIRAKK
jgi:hypothetical protein